VALSIDLTSGDRQHDRHVQAGGDPGRAGLKPPIESREQGLAVALQLP